MKYDEAVTRLIEQRERQGLPRTVEDPAVLARVAALLLDRPKGSGDG